MSPLMACNSEKLAMANSTKASHGPEIRGESRRRGGDDQGWPYPAHRVPSAQRGPQRASTL
jgi:hypothetical protein